MKVSSIRIAILGVFLNCLLSTNSAQAIGIGEIVEAALPSPIAPQLSEGETDPSDAGRKVCITLGRRPTGETYHVGGGQTAQVYETYRVDSVIVPSSWTVHDCAGWTGTQFQLGCFFSTGKQTFGNIPFNNAVEGESLLPKFSVGAELSSTHVTGGLYSPTLKPPRNCGW